MNTRRHSGPGKAVGIILPENILITPLPFDLLGGTMECRFEGKTFKDWSGSS
jgi:hypothetical protein